MGDSTSCHPVCDFSQKRPVVLGIGSTVGGFQQGSPLVLRFLVEVPLDIPVQQFDKLMPGLRGLSMWRWSLSEMKGHTTLGRELQ